MLEELLKQLMGQAGPRGATYAGRVIPQGQQPNLKQLLTQQPTESPDAEGIGGGAAMAMAKVFKPGPSLAARIARKGSQPVTDLEKMFPALIDQSTGDVIHAMGATGAGGHRALWEQAGAMKNFNPTRGFLDPSTFDAYTEAMLEEILANKHGFR